jgi:hypothetical protein
VLQEDLYYSKNNRSFCCRKKEFWHNVRILIEGKFCARGQVYDKRNSPLYIKEFIRREFFL